MLVAAGFGVWVSEAAQAVRASKRIKAAISLFIISFVLVFLIRRIDPFAEPDDLVTVLYHSCDVNSPSEKADRVRHDMHNHANIEVLPGSSKDEWQ